MRLIEVLNKIANGELKEGTKFVYRRNMYIWKDNMILNTSNLEPFDIADRSDLNMELELIEPNHYPDVGKMAEHIRENTKMIEPTDNTKIEELSAWGRTSFEYGSPVPADWVMANKINEVIRILNKRG